MWRRNISPVIRRALQDTPVVFVRGARQTGKTTIAREVAEAVHAARYLTLDDAVVLAAAHHDPAGFLASLQGLTVIDEAQRVPELFLPIKALVDHDPRPGRFLLTGSADVLLLPQIADSLAGRMEVLTLWPFSQGEIAGVVDGFIDTLFQKKPSFVRTAVEGQDPSLASRLLQGGYPALLKRSLQSRRRAWLGSYITAILQRDVRDLSSIDDLTVLPRLLALIASRSASLLNLSDLSRSLSIPQTTLKRYLSLLETTFLVRLLPAWSTNLGKRLAKSSKLYITDSGLVGYLLGLNQDRLRDEPMLMGPLLENFVAMELSKQAGWSEVHVDLFHYREQNGQEVDLVLENEEGEIVGVEVKASSSVGASDFKGLRSLAETTGKRFRRGVVLYTGPEPVPFGTNLLAVPVSYLWAGAANA